MTELKPQKRKRRSLTWKTKVLFLLSFLVGLGLILFPIVSQFLYYQAAQVEIKNFDQTVKKLEPNDIDWRIKLAHAYNSTIEPSLNGMTDPFSQFQQEGIAEYARMLEVNEQIGYISIPNIFVEIPVYAGTTEKVLQKGAGHLEATSLPVGGKGTHTVITAHRGLPNARLFTDLDKLKLGDVFYIQNIKETLAYQIDKIKTVEPTDIKSIRIIDGEDRATLLTCTPYMINSHRLLVMGHRIPYSPEEKAEQVAKPKQSIIFQILLILLIIILVLLATYVLRKYILQRKRNKQTD